MFFNNESLIGCLNTIQFEWIDVDWHILSWYQYEEIPLQMRLADQYQFMIT
jgi:hypothetical protein